jgi:hypothetical protein
LMQDRKQETLDEFFRTQLKATQRARIEAVCVEECGHGSEPVRETVVKVFAPGALNSIDTTSSACDWYGGVGGILNVAATGCARLRAFQNLASPYIRRIIRLNTDSRLIFPRDLSRGPSPIPRPFVSPVSPFLVVDGKPQFALLQGLRTPISPKSQRVVKHVQYVTYLCPCQRFSL